jgi:hypothetical protein
MFIQFLKNYFALEDICHTEKNGYYLYYTIPFKVLAESAFYNILSSHPFKVLVRVFLKSKYLKTLNQEQNYFYLFFFILQFLNLKKISTAYYDYIIV